MAKTPQKQGGSSEKVGPGHPPKEHQFKPGHSGNPKGRQKGTSLTDRLRKIVEENEGQVGEALMKAAVKAALQGDWRFWNSIVERIDGKVADQLNMSGDVRFDVRIPTEEQPPEEDDADVDANDK